MVISIDPTQTSDQQTEMRPMPKRNENRRPKSTRPRSENAIAELLRHLDGVLEEAESVREMLADVEAQLQTEGFLPRREKGNE